MSKASAPEAILEAGLHAGGEAVHKVNDCATSWRRAVEATFIAGAEDLTHTIQHAPASAEAAAQSVKKQMEVMLPAIILVVWTASAVAMTYHTKWALKSEDKDGAGFEFPVFFTFVTTLVTFAGCTMILVLQKKTNTIGINQFKAEWKGIAAIAALSILAVWASDASLMYIGVTLNQLLKACTPFPTMCFGYFVERKRFAVPMVVAVFTIVLGAILSIPFSDASMSAYGLIMASFSTLCGACKISLAARLMSNSAVNGLTPLVLLFYSAAASVPPLLIWFLAIDERVEVGTYMHDKPGTAAIVLVLASLYAFLVQLLGNTLTKVTSALTMTIAAAGRQIGIIFVTGVFIEHTFKSAINWVGVAIFVASIAAYAAMTYNPKLMPKTLPIDVGAMAKSFFAAVPAVKTAVAEGAVNFAHAVTEHTPLNKGSRHES